MMLWINVAISLSTFVIIEIIRKSPIYRIFGLSSPVTPGEAISDKRKFVIFLFIKWLYIFVPLIIIVILPSFTIGDLYILGFYKFHKGNLIAIILMTILVVGFSILLYPGIKSIKGLFKSFFAAWIIAGLPEDILIIGFLGGALFKAFLSILPPFAAMILSYLLIEFIFSASHLPNVKRDEKLYATHMNGKDTIKPTRVILQMTIFSLPSWILFFISGNVFYSSFWHAAADMAAFFPDQNSEKNDNDINK
jgi:hypothetical protein